MKFIIAVHNLDEKKAHLMPWRTAIEIVHGLNKSGHEARLVSLGNSFDNLMAKVFPENTVEIRKSLKYFKQDLDCILKQTFPDLLFWPVTWRESKMRTNIAASMNFPIVGWFPGGVYSFRSVFFAFWKMTFIDTLPYLIETLCINLSKAGLIKQSRFDAIITMTQTTAQTAEKTGWQGIRTYVIPPGKNKNDQPVFCKANPVFLNWLDDRPYFLFMGPPSKIRGIYELLRAFELAAGQNERMCLVCLFRSDGILDEKHIKNYIQKLKYQDRIFCIWESLSPKELNMYKKKCHAVVMPFLLVPSEIPLAIIETMSWGKPVITSSSGGTGNFVLSFGAAPKTGDIKQLAKTMLDFVTDKTLYQQKCFETITANQLHPSWEMVARRWLEVAENILKDFKKCQVK